MTSTRTALSIGVAGSLGPYLIAQIAHLIEAAGFHALWVNDTPNGDAIEGLAAAARVTETLRLATGVVPLDRRGPEDILRALERAEIPDDRLTLGLGSGSARSGQLALVRDGIARIREVRAPRIVVGALGPRMRRLAARDADGPLLTWLTPAVAAAQRDQARAARETTRTHLYVRTAFDAGAQDRMLREADRYASYPNYAANFARLGVDARDTVLPGPGADDVSAGLGEYLAAVDEVVLRAIVGEDDFAEYEAFVAEAVAARRAVD